MRASRIAWCPLVGALLGTCTPAVPGLTAPPQVQLPHGALPPPAGTYLGQWQTAQAVKAEADDFVIYRGEWLQDGLTLGPYGQYHLRQMLERLPRVPYPVVIQVGPNASLNETRRQAVVQQLQVSGIADAELRVHLGWPRAEGLYGVESLRVYGRLLSGSGPESGNGGESLGGMGFGTGLGFGRVGGLGGFFRGR